MEKVNLLIPSTKEGNGTGHIKRMISLAEKLDGRSLVYVAPQDLDRVLPTFPENMREFITTTMERPENYSRIILDNRETDRRFYREHVAGGFVIAIDEGGPLREEIPYLIDILPMPSGYSKPNYSSLSFLSLPGIANAGNEGKILVSFGGEDPAGLTEKLCLSVLAEDRDLASRIIVVLGPQYRWETPDPLFEVRRNPDSFHKLMASCGAVVCSYGLTAFEALYLDKPVMIVNPTDYHEELTEKSGLASAGVLLKHEERLLGFLRDPQPNLGEKPDFSGPELSRFIEELDRPEARCPVCSAREYTVAGRYEKKSYCRCDDCGMLYMLNYTKEKMSYGEEYFFNQYREQYGKTYLDDFDHISGLAEKRLEIIGKIASSGGTLLDAGCAYGPFLSKARERGWKAFGTDISSEAAAYVENELGIPVLSGRFEDFSIPAAWECTSFSALTMWYVIEHFSDLAPVLSRVNRLLEPGGIFAFSTPSGSGVSARTDFLNFLRCSPDDHYTVWEPEKCGKILGLYGFEIDRIRVTGHHPERFPSFLKNSRTGRGLLRLYSRLFGRGDTFEIYTRKVRDI